MNHDFEIKLQAWMDGELSEDDASRFIQTASTDPQARQLLDELKSVKAAMASNELDRKTPASREFYWNQIQRQIQRQETLDAPRVAPALIPSLLARWRRIIVPVAGAALGAALLVVSVKQATPTPEFVETTDTSSDFDAMTYHDQHSGMTVVWLKFREQEPAPADAAPDIFDVR